MDNLIPYLARAVLFILAVLILSTVMVRCVEAQPEYITCSNGTNVIHVAYPGMCPVGYWQI